MTTVTSEIVGFADTGDARNKIITDTLLGVPRTTKGDVTVTVEYLGDFGDAAAFWPDEWFTVDIEGYALNGQFKGLQSQLTSTTLSIAASDWATIIADGSIGITYTTGPEVDNLDTDPNEFMRLSFTWEEKPKPPSRDPDPTNLTGTEGDDLLPGTKGRDIIDGRGGNDVIYAGDENDVVKGGLGDDIIGGGSGSDELRGGEGNDIMFGGTGQDTILGGDGDDIVWAGSGNDQVKGANGNDALGGGAGNDEMFGGAGHDTVFGGVGNDELFGNMGNDALFGGLGRDSLDGGFGNDSMFGGAGIDTFIFGTAEGDDVIRDFQAGGDFIDLHGQTYTVSENQDGFAVLELSGGGTVTLEGIASADVSADWFLAA